MYTSRDRDAIHADMLDGIREDVDKREGSVVHDLLMPPAEELDLLGYALNAILENGFIDTAQAEFVDKRAAELGIYRKQAEAARGKLVFADVPGTEIPAGTEVLARKGDALIALQTAAYAVVGADGTAEVDALASVPGVEGNIGADSELSCESLPNAIVSNPAEFSGGVDVEPDEEVKARYRLKVQKPITSGNVYHYELWAREVEGISQARVQPLHDGPGTVKVVIADSEGRAPTPEQVAKVAAHIETMRPIGATVTVAAINEIPINVAVTLTLNGDLLAEDVREEVEANIAQYLAEAGTLIRYTQIANAISRVENVLDYSGLAIGIGEDLGTENIEVSADDVAVIGQVTLV